MKRQLPTTNCGRWYDLSSVSRREMLRRTASGFGMTALAGLLARESVAADPQLAGGVHFPARAKRVIWLFMGGGPSHVDTVDPKPILAKYHRKEIPIALPGHLRDSTKKVLATPFEFARHGESGLPISQLLPGLAKHADDLCVIRSMHCDSIDHTGATLQTFTGMASLPRPGMGCWILYGLGTENQNLPGYVVLGPDQQSGTATYSSRFLPAVHQGTKVEWRAEKLKDAASALPNLRNRAGLSVERQREQLDLLRELNGFYREKQRDTDAIDARAESFELAFRMQAAAPEAFDLSRETESTRKAYGLDNKVTRHYGVRCLLARRLVERGVRFVQLQCGKGDGLDWDQHGGLKDGHTKNAATTDGPVSALISDLKQRGLLDDTLVIWGGEFGRTPTSQGTDGREHHPHGYSLCLIGGGVRGGYAHGATDEFGWYAVEKKVGLHDFHATVLHLLGIDHERLTYRHIGREFRLTDVHGQVVHDIIS
ncbi:MAG: DUF1501 domain-containing protein [Planctomycetota bacterium]